MKRLLAILLCLIGSSAHAQTIRSHLKCQDNAASTVVVATTGNNGVQGGGDNTSVKSVAGPDGDFPDTPGNFPLALRQNGTDDGITVNVDLSPYDVVMVTCWAKIPAFDNGDDLLFEYTPNVFSFGNHGFVADPNASFPTTGNFWAGLHSDSGGISGGAIPRPSAATWHHYAFVFDMTQATNEYSAAYVDGNLQTITYSDNTNNTGETFSNSTLYWASRNSASLFLEVDLCDLRVYSGAANQSFVVDVMEEVTGVAASAGPYPQIIVSQ